MAYYPHPLPGSWRDFGKETLWLAGHCSWRFQVSQVGFFKLGEGWETIASLHHFLDFYRSRRLENEFCELCSIEMSKEKTEKKLNDYLQFDGVLRCWCSRGVLTLQTWCLPTMLKNGSLCWYYFKLFGLIWLVETFLRRFSITWSLPRNRMKPAPEAQPQS